MRLLENWRDNSNANKSVQKDLFMRNYAPNVGYYGERPFSTNFMKNRKGSTEDAIRSFIPKGKLNDKIWNDNNKLKQEIRHALLRLAHDFMKDVNLKENHIDDIVLTGSLANFNWSEYSDYDLHIIVDLNKLSENTKLIKDYFDTKKARWNDEHDIEIYDYPVEIYVQSREDAAYSTGVYSLIDNKWLVKPSGKNFNLDEPSVKNKADALMGEIDRMLKMKEPELALDKIENFKQKLRNMRSSGLEKDGEYSTENLAFKTLRRNGYIEKLNNFKNKMYDKKFSIE